MKLGKLYKKNVKGTIEEWEISIKANYITITFGDMDGKKQVKHDEIKVGKNIGSKNETTPVQQAEKEAIARFNKQLKKGYCKTLKDALAGNVDEIIKGGILPMLAEKYKDEEDGYVQPKLDGQRCVAIKEDDVITLWTRSRKPILSCPHIILALQEILEGYDMRMEIDGELYNHELKHNFEALMSAVRKQYPTPESRQIQFHIYDCNFPELPASFNERLKYINDLPELHECIEFVPTYKVNSVEEVKKYHDQFVAKGYEGLMFRDASMPYEYKRSKGLLKYKNFSDDEFEVLSVLQGGDGAVVFMCRDDKGDTFEAPMNGNKENNQKYLKNHNLWKGKFLNVRYQGLTGAKKVPRFPQGKYIRELE